MRWKEIGTAPPETVRALTDEYLAEEDGFGQWLAECCVRDPTGFERSSDLHSSYLAWCDKNGNKSESDALLSRYLVACGFGLGVAFVASPCARYDTYDTFRNCAVYARPHTRTYVPIRNKRHKRHGLDVSGLIATANRCLRPF